MIRRLFFIGLLLAGLGCSALRAQADLPPEYQLAYEKAIKLFNANDFEGTLKQLDEAEKIKAGVVATQNLRGAAYVRTKNYAEAQKIFGDLYKKDADNVMALFNLGETYFLQKNYTEALRHFQLFTEKSKTEKSLGQYKVFLCNLQLGKTNEAKKIMDATMASPLDPLYYYLHSAYLFKQDKPVEARSYLVSAFQIYSGTVNAAFVDSLIELGYIDPNELKASGGGQAPVVEAPGAVGVPPPATAPIPDISGLENLLPGLDPDKDKKK